MEIEGVIENLQIAWRSRILPEKGKTDESCTEHERTKNKKPIKATKIWDNVVKKGNKKLWEWNESSQTQGVVVIVS